MITLDIDGKNIGRRKCALNTLRAYTKLHFHEPKRKIEIWLSSSGKGFHLIRYGDDGSINTELCLREFYGDDLRRVKIDRFKRRIGSPNCNVLWIYKDGKKAKRVSLDLLVKFALGM